MSRWCQGWGGACFASYIFTKEGSDKQEDRSPGWKSDQLWNYVDLIFSKLNPTILVTGCIYET